MTTGVRAEGQWRVRHFGQDDLSPDVKSFQHIHVDAGYRAKGSVRRPRVTHTQPVTRTVVHTVGTGEWRRFPTS